MPKSDVIEQEIEAAIQLSAKREFAAAMVLYQEMLTRADDDEIRRKVLYGVVTCAVWLNREDLLTRAVEELKRLPDYEASHAFIVFTRARAALDFGRPQEALDLINENLASEVLQQADFRDRKYDRLYLKGRCLVRLKRCDEALDAFDAAHDINPEGEFETDMLIERSNCLLFAGRFGEAYSTASQVLSRSDDDMATLAMQYMAESRLWQREPREALALYASIQKRLPCPFIQEERIQNGIKSAVAQLEAAQPPSAPS